MKQEYKNSFGIVLLIVVLFCFDLTVHSSTNTDFRALLTEVSSTSNNSDNQLFSDIDSVDDDHFFEFYRIRLILKTTLLDDNLARFFDIQKIIVSVWQPPKL
jgi:hypothetical protein